MKNKSLIYFMIAAIFLLPTVNCVTVSVKTSVGAFGEHLGSSIDDQITGNTVVTKATLSNAVWALRPTNSKSSSTGNLNFANFASATDNTGNEAMTYVSISNANSYDYAYGTSNSPSAAAEAFNAYGASAVAAYAKAINVQTAGPAVYVTLSQKNGDVVGYNNLAIAADNLGYAFQSFDSATGTIYSDSVARSLPSKYTPALETSTPMEAYITNRAAGTVTNYEGAVVKSSLGTSLEQNAGVQGTFTSTSVAGTNSITRTSDYGTTYDLDMQANIANSVPSVKGTLTYYMDPTLNIQRAVDKSKSGDLINLAAGTYNQNANIGKSVTVRGQGVTGSITDEGAITNSGGKNYVNSKEVFVRADDFYKMNPGWTWLTDITNSKDFSATYAVIPYWLTWSNAIQLAQLMDKSKVEIATHGYNHEKFAGLSYQDQYNLINKGTNLLTIKFYRPRTFIPPTGADDQNTIDACNALGYHSISGNYVSGAQGIAQFVPGLYWETDWSVPESQVPHYTFDEFKHDFDSFYSSSNQRLTVLLHPNTYVDANGNLKTDDANAFEQSIDYMNGKNVEFMTMDQAYRWDK